MTEPEATELACELAARLREAEADNARYRGRLNAINRLTSPGTRTPEEMVRDMMMVCDLTRAALKGD